MDCNKKWQLRMAGRRELAPANDLNSPLTLRTSSMLETLGRVPEESRQQRESI
jgi:hypothetical protein